MKAYRRLVLVMLAWMTIVGVVVLVQGYVVGAVAWLVFWGSAGALIFFMPRLTHGGAGTTQVIAFEGRRALLFPIGRRKQRLAVYCCAGMALGALIFAVEAPVAGLAGAGLFGAAAAVNVWGMRGPHGLILTPTRIVFAGPPRAELAWEDVAWAGIVDTGRTRALAVKARPGVRRGLVARLSAAVGGGEISLNADTLEGPPEEAVAEILFWRDHPAQRRPGGRGQLPTAPIIASG